MYSFIYTAVILGIEPVPVRVEADVSDGMPQFDMVGYLSGEVKEARERVRTALNNSGYRLPPKKITINLTPANIRKSGNGCDLPVAAAILSALGIIEKEPLSHYLIMGEVGLDGSILPVRGTLAAAIMASQKNMHGMILPRANAKEAAVYSGIPIYPVDSISDFIELCYQEFPDEAKAGRRRFSCPYLGECTAGRGGAPEGSQFLPGRYCGTADQKYHLSGCCYKAALPGRLCV